MSKYGAISVLLILAANITVPLYFFYALLIPPIGCAFDTDAVIAAGATESLVDGCHVRTDHFGAVATARIN